MTIPACLREQDGAVVLTLKVQPRARMTGLAGMLGDALKLKVTAPPVDSAANEAVLEHLAAVFQLPRRSLSLIRGATSTHKLVRLDGITLPEAATRLSETL